ncbi:DUF1360 domain-containing protein [Neobacillus sp. MM2021_6]|uniref:DUF1360 domain-containing protein n=1 Tax=Bacillaceae TaxID=186817 RepID=UPI00140C7582|nr:MULTISPECIES: DUF1360 domain-containing protein [Bacillaceae]MBO0962594.1 DUF1360 domain-containing protein [Neobacillus sp. MM2021_6]NHC16680.1 DUF1360 domain-containing protein [Bacillus sp. MM2020_4]
MKITFLSFVIFSLSSFRLTRLLVFDKITEFIREPFFDEVVEENEEGEKDVYYLPKKTGFKKFMGELLSCYWCTGIWAAALIIVFYYISPAVSTPIILILAVAGLAAIVEVFVQYFI